MAKNSKEMKSMQELSATINATVNVAAKVLGKKAAVRSTWKGMLTFGGVSFPVNVYTGTEAEKVSFSQLHDNCMSKLNQRMYCPKCGDYVEKDHILKGYAKNGTEYITVTDAELDACKPDSSRTMEVQKFVPASSVDPIYFETTHYLAPDKGGEKAFAMLRAGMVKQHAVAIATFTKSSRENTVVIRPYGEDGIVVHSMYFDVEVRSFKWQGLPTSLTNREAKVGSDIVSLMLGEFDPNEYTDTYRDNVVSMITAKMASEPAPVVIHKEAPKAGSISDDFLDDIEAKISRKK